MIRKLKQLWRLWRALPACPRGAVAWQQFDSDQLSGFLHSPTGKKLLFMLQVTEETQNQAAIASADRFACGIAMGWRAHNHWLLNLTQISAQPAPQDGPSETTGAEGASDYLDRLAP